MPSPLHDAIVGLFLDRPDLAPSLIRELLGIDIPDWSTIEVREATMSDLVTAEYRADLVLLLVDKKPVFAIVVEVQLGIDRDKAYRWLSYVATVRDRWRCPVTLLVVTPDENVAEWARQPIEFSGPGSVFVPLVLGPADIPVIRRGQPTTPEAAVLSALAHARDPGNLEAITVAVEQLASLDEATRLFYYDLVVSRLDEATRIALVGLMQQPGY